MAGLREHWIPRFPGQPLGESALLSLHLSLCPPPLFPLSPRKCGGWTPRTPTLQRPRKLSQGPGVLAEGFPHGQGGEERLQTAPWVAPGPGALHQPPAAIRAFQKALLHPAQGPPGLSPLHGWRICSGGAWGGQVTARPLLQNSIQGVQHPRGSASGGTPEPSMPPDQSSQHSGCGVTLK